MIVAKSSIIQSGQILYEANKGNKRIFYLLLLDNIGLLPSRE